MNFCKYFIISRRAIRAAEYQPKDEQFLATKRIHTVSIYEPISMVIRDSCSDESLPPPLSLSPDEARHFYVACPGRRTLRERERERKEKMGRKPRLVRPHRECAGARLSIKAPRSDSASAENAGVITAGRRNARFPTSIGERPACRCRSAGGNSRLSVPSRYSGAGLAHNRAIMRRVVTRGAHARAAPRDRSLRR